MPKRIRPNSPESDAVKKSKDSSAESTVFLHLNDDCLRVVFSYLNFQDLCHVKETCSRFELLADESFRRKYSRCEFKYSLEYCKSCEFTPSRTLRCFGKLMHGLHVFRIKGVHATDYWTEIVENCTQLKNLAICECDLEGFQLIQTPARVNSQKIRHLKLKNCWGNDDQYTRIVTYFADVKKLEIWSSAQEISGTFLARHFPRLRSLTLQYVSANENLDKFIRFNPQIEALFAEQLNDDQVVTIAENWNNIRSLSILCDASSANYTEKIARLGRLARLKKLQFNYCGRSIAAAIGKLAETNLLEFLGLTHGKLDIELCLALCKFSRLKTLKLVGVRQIHANLLEELMTGLNLKDIHFINCNDLTFAAVAVAIKHSRSLENITFGNTADYPLDDDSYLRFVKARQESLNAIPLILVVDFIQMSVEVIEEYSNFVEVKECDTSIIYHRTILCFCNPDNDPEAGDTDYFESSEDESVEDGLNEDESDEGGLNEGESDNGSNHGPNVNESKEQEENVDARADGELQK